MSKIIVLAPLLILLAGCADKIELEARVPKTNNCVRIDDAGLVFCDKYPTLPVTPVAEGADFGIRATRKF